MLRHRHHVTLTVHLARLHTEREENELRYIVEVVVIVSLSALVVLESPGVGMLHECYYYHKFCLTQTYYL